jgi:hypothetical protein
MIRAKESTDAPAVRQPALQSGHGKGSGYARTRRRRGGVAGLADRTGLTAQLSAATARWGFVPVHDRGRVLADLAVAIADGARVLSDLSVLRDQCEVFGSVASGRPCSTWSHGYCSSVSWMDLVARESASVAWPVAAVVIAALLRRHLTSVLPDRPPSGTGLRPRTR